MAIMVGTRTVLLDNPCLKATHWSGRNPIRITFDRHNVIPVSSNILSNDADTIVYKEDTSWEFVLNDLAKRKVHSLLVEGGSCLLNMILKSGIYDEVHVEVSPVALGVETDDADNGGVGAPVMELPETSSMIDGHAVYVLKNSKKFV
jgi:diaminohydroxyphosphoribosylaminopyrimidine deaminase/5-amino-6-(5-phosphoribosylamino)uracil reductase